MDTGRLTRHDRLVLAYLTIERFRSTSREELAELVWEHRVPVSWKTALRGVARWSVVPASATAGAVRSGRPA
jgi:hypothetical protein